ncbi:hypothetical protein [Streptomyces nondiastaticus]
MAKSASAPITGAAARAIRRPYIFTMVFLSWCAEPVLVTPGRAAERLDDQHICRALDDPPHFWLPVIDRPSRSWREED